MLFAPCVATNLLCSGHELWDEHHTEPEVIVGKAWAVFGPLGRTAEPRVVAPTAAAMHAAATRGANGISYST